MSKPTLDGNNSRAIAANETELTRLIQQTLIRALTASKRGERELLENLLAQAMQHTADLNHIADLVRRGRYQEALALIDQKQIKAGDK